MTMRIRRLQLQKKARKKNLPKHKSEGELWCLQNRLKIERLAESKKQNQVFFRC